MDNASASNCCGLNKIDLGTWYSHTLWCKHDRYYYAMVSGARDEVLGVVHVLCTWFREDPNINGRGLLRSGRANQTNS